MNRPRHGILWWVILAFFFAVSPLTAQQQPPPLEDPGGTPDGELREAMRRYLHNQLRMELALSDEQMAELSPRMERIEDARSQARRARGATMRELQRGLREGAGDQELQQRVQQLRRERMGGPGHGPGESR